MKILTCITFALLGVMIICLAVGTVVEHGYGSSVSATYIYNSWWFAVLWGLLFGGGISLCVWRSLYRRKATFLLHGSFGVILLGALLTFVTVERGFIHLRVGEPLVASTIQLPFDIQLKAFDVKYYEGTSSPMNYVSRVEIIEDTNVTEVEISMNKIFKTRGYRLSQASFDDDRKGSVIAVNYDPWGTSVTYVGYSLLAISMCWILFSRRCRYRTLLRSLCLIGGLLSSFTVTAQTTIPATEAAILGRLPMLEGDRVVPLDTYARDFVLKLYGKPYYKEYSAVQVLAGWYFFSDEWKNVPLIRVKEASVRQLIDGEEYVSYADFYTPQGEYKLLARWPNPTKQKAVDAVNEKIQLIHMVQNGTALKLFPVNGVWYAPSDYTRELKESDQLFIHGIFDLMYESLQAKDYPAVCQLLDKISQFQRRDGGSLPSENKITAEITYNHLNINTWLYRFNLLIGLFALAYSVWSIIRNRRRLWFELVFLIPLFVCFFIQTVVLGLRWYIGGHIPLGNGYETMMFVAWCILLVSLLFYRKFRLAVASGFLLSGFALLVASLGMMNPQITPLMPVLVSPWLSLHVSLIMVSYALFAFITLNGVIALVANTGDHKNMGQKLHVMSEIMLYPALFLLTAGIFVGAVWANVSWGRYWGWDPKEVWALITMLVYAIPLHRESIPRFCRPLFFHAYCVVAFCTVLMTYFGVNYLLGGMHSYAG